MGSVVKSFQESDCQSSEATMVASVSHSTSSLSSFQVEALKIKFMCIVLCKFEFKLRFPVRVNTFDEGCAMDTSAKTHESSESGRDTLLCVLEGHNVDDWSWE
jgi:hypothetical protein